MGGCWSSRVAEAVRFAMFLKYQEKNVEWSKCTRVVLVLQWKIYFFWVFGLQLYSLVIDAVKFLVFTSAKEVIRGSDLMKLYHHRSKFHALFPIRKISSTVIVHMVSLLTHQMALELIYQMGSLSWCFKLTSRSIKRSTCLEVKSSGNPSLPVWLVLSEDKRSVCFRNQTRSQVDYFGISHWGFYKNREDSFFWYNAVCKFKFDLVSSTECIRGLIWSHFFVSLTTVRSSLRAVDIACYKQQNEVGCSTQVSVSSLAWSVFCSSCWMYF